MSMGDIMERSWIYQTIFDLFNRCGVSGGCWKKEPFPLLEKQHIIKVVTIPPLNRDGTQYKLKTDWNDCVTYDECPTVPQVSE